MRDTHGERFGIATGRRGQSQVKRNKTRSEIGRSTRGVYEASQRTSPPGRGKDLDCHPGPQN